MSACLVDYGAGNLHSLRSALERAGAAVTVADRPAEVESAALVVIPGVGAAGAAMAELERRGLVAAIRRALDGGARLFGVCVGLQLLFDRSDEGDTACLGLLPGTVTRLVGARRLPHMGWNDVEPTGSHPLAPRSAAVCYFAHSYAVQDAPAQFVAARTPVEHGGFASVVAHDRIAGVQFHPERSGRAGCDLLGSMLAWAAG